MNSFHFRIQNEGNGEQREFDRPVFSPSDKQQLVEYCAFAARLNECSLVKNWPNTRISIHLANDGRITNTGALPSDEAIAAFLHRFRPICLNNEAANFERIANLVSQRLNDTAITECIRNWKRYYDGRDSQEVFQIAITGKVLNSREFFDHYVNALEYHFDNVRRQHIDAIAQHFPLEAQKPIFVLLLGLRLNAINKLASFLLTCFEREDGRPITIQVT